MDPQFRIARDDDAPLLLALMQQYYAFDGHHWHENRAREGLLNLLRCSQYGLAWLVLDAETPVGYIVLTFGYSLEFLGRDAFIDEFFLLPSHRGRGWGKKTLAFVEEQARHNDVRAIHLEIVRTNDNAKRLYSKTGFVDRNHYLMSKKIASEPA